MVLLVDDNAGKRLALKSILLPLGHQIVEADSGQAALRRVMVQDFAVILIDVHMPGMDGFETASFIRQRRQSEMTPIIFITACSPDEIGSGRYVEGAVDFIFAPVKPDELRAKVTVFANLFLRAGHLARQAEEVQRSADRLRLLTESAPIGIFQTNTRNQYVYTNPCWTEITGVPAEEALGKDWYSILDAEERAGFAAGAAVSGAHPADLSDRFEITSRHSTRTVLITSRSISDDTGAISGWVGTLADVTAEAWAEAALSEARDKADEASQLKSDFLANMSHEIRTPMNGVIGMTELLLESELDPRQREYVQTVRNSGEALMVIVNDILDFSKAEAGMHQLEHLEFDPRAIVEGSVDLLARLARAKGIELTAFCDVPALVAGDPGRIRQILINLIGNAIKFTHRGEIVVRVTTDDPPTDSTTNGSVARTTLRFEVADTGDGIAADKLDMIFEPFSQADSSTSRRYGGTGLGLAISSNLVALMGGECGVTSQLGEGSTFWFTIVVGSAPDAVKLAVTNGEVTTGRVLLAEDNVVNQTVAVAMLSGAGYRVDTVPDGRAAVQAAARHTYDVILMDCQMPELDGYEATAAIRAQSSPGRDTPIIAMTADARDEDRLRCLAAGMDSYIAKPVTKQTLLAVVAQTIRGSAHARESSSQQLSTQAASTRTSSPLNGGA